MSNIPTLAAYIIKSCPEDCFVWCPSCKEWHRHTTPQNLQTERGAHCRSKKSKYINRGYHLKIVGEINKVHEGFIIYDKYKTPPKTIGIKVYGEISSD